MNEYIDKRLKKIKFYKDCLYARVPVSNSKGVLTVLEPEVTHTEVLKFSIINGEVVPESTLRRNIVGLSPIIRLLSRKFKKGNVNVCLYLYKLKPKNKRSYISQYYVEV